ncbi:MAG TPA: 2-dehydro-3-deoxy-6-phosphogalactonate aldolase, partial [Steroidobacteraceae bacterium]|nr:2-dehydro-3-deoxy-6-phosphogalactonate aldolase [Steroidobacteraceae bacterium]
MKVQSPIVAILRGITVDRAESVARALYDAGIRIIEVTFNSPDPLSSIKKITQLNLQDCLIGAGTVVSVDDVQRTYDAGGRLVVTPNCDVGVISKALQLGMTVLPGIATPTEAFAAVHAGASHLKLFPAATYGVQHLKALKSVLPTHVKIFPVGGIGANDIAQWRQAGANGFGFGSELFKPDYSLDEIAERARQIINAYDS